MNAFYGFRAIARKEFMHIRRERSTLIFALLIPVIQLIMFGYAVNFDVRYVKTVVVDQDRSRESREYIASLANTHYLQIVQTAPSSDQAANALVKGSARVAVIIPPDFSRRYGTSRPPEVQVLVDGSDSQVANPAIQALQGGETGVPHGSVAPKIDVLFNPNSHTQTYTIPGLIGVILQLVTVSLTSFSLVRERESGSLDQLMVTPVGRLGLMVGKLAPYAVLSSVEFLGIVFAAHLLFDVPVRGSFVLLSFLAILFIICALSLGLLISTIATSTAEAQQLMLLTILPSILLSGYIAPVETFPGALTIASQILPITHFIQITRGLMVRGAGFQDLLTPICALTGITLLLLTLATVRFRKTVN